MRTRSLQPVQMSLEFGDLVLKAHPVLRAQRAIFMRMTEQFVVLALKRFGLSLQLLMLGRQLVVRHLMAFYPPPIEILPKDTEEPFKELPGAANRRDSLRLVADRTGSSR